MSEKLIQVRFDGDLLQALRNAAIAEKRWLSQQVQVYVQEGLERRGYIPSTQTPGTPPPNIDGGTKNTLREFTRP